MATATINGARCPLCGEDRLCRSWLGSTWYRGREFPYAQCRGCGSLFCDPMPDEATLCAMYGPEYGTGFAFDPRVDDSKEPGRLLGWLESLPPGTFLDYGCGTGGLLVEAARRGWEAVGVEFDESVARNVATATGGRVFTVAQAAALDRPLADVLHLGDVIEHLTELERQMPAILRLLKPGGVLVAQGPLEANANVFTAALRLARRVRPRRTEMAPYHVLLATARGQRGFFRRLGLEELEFLLSEVAWPAPARLTASDLRRPRPVVLFAARRVSQAVSTLRPHAWGNRYFYAGRHRESAPPRGNEPCRT